MPCYYIILYKKYCGSRCDVEEVISHSLGTQLSGRTVHLYMLTVSCGQAPGEGAKRVDRERESE